VLLLGGFPIFWALGLPNLAAPLMAVPMLWHLLTHRPIRLPRGFLLWLLFLAWSVLSLTMIGVNPPGTLPEAAGGRLFGFGLREVSYLADTIVFLYIGNLSEEEFPQRRLVRLLGLMFLWTVAGGLLGTLAPHFEFTSPFELILPEHIRNQFYVQQLVHPNAAQLQVFGTTETPRPAAPFGYTNAWGFHLTLLAVWFVAGWFLHRRWGVRAFAVVVLAVGGIVLIYSLNRAAWAGVFVALAFVAFRLALRRRVMPLALMLIGLVVVGLVVFASPLHGVIENRISEGKSNRVRAFTTEKALELSRRSPVLGYGSTRNARGSATSIAIGRSASCPQCGNTSIGINGYFFMLLVTTGWVGVLLFFSFWWTQVWNARGDPSVVTAAGIAVILLSSLYAFTYDVSTWLLIPFVSLAILWRQATARADSPR
jgi:hypothetical protein